MMIIAQLHQHFCVYMHFIVHYILTCRKFKKCFIGKIDLSNKIIKKQIFVKETVKDDQMTTNYRRLKKEDEKKLIENGG